MGVLFEDLAVDPERATAGKPDRVYRPSSILLYEDCPKAYWFRFLEKAVRGFVPANLLFGTAVHEAVSSYLLDRVAGPDIADAFLTSWRKGISEEPVEFSSSWNPKSMEDVGVRLCGLFPAYWSQTGLSAASDLHGSLVERRLRTEVAPGISLSGQPDIIARTRDGRIVVLDLKTPASAQPELWWSDQLLAYQILVDRHKAQLGLNGVNGLGFIEMLKQKTAPRIVPLKPMPAKPPEEVDEYIQKIILVDRDIQEGRFPRRGRMAHNTPCGMCEHQTKCLTGAQ